MSDPEEFNALRLIREGSRAEGDALAEMMPNLIGGLHYWHSVASRLRRDNAELRATIERVRDLPEPPGYDDRKELLDIWYDNGGTVSQDIGLRAVYPALIAVARWGWDRATEADGQGCAPVVVETAEELDALPDGTVYLSDGHDVAEQKLGGVWYAVGSRLPFEPDLPGAVLWTPKGEPGDRTTGRRQRDR